MTVLSDASTFIPGQDAAMARQLVTSTRMLRIKGHCRHIFGFTG
jgi:hypothetical protein